MSRMGDTIRTARLKAKMTEKALGRKCGLAESVIKDIESGRRIASDDQAQRILKVLGAQDSLSTELDAAAEPPQPLPKPRPRAYVVPLEPDNPQKESATREASDAWLDALGGVVKRVPVIDPQGVAVEPRAHAHHRRQDRGRRAGQGAVLPLPGQTRCAASACSRATCS